MFSFYMYPLLSAILPLLIGVSLVWFGRKQIRKRKEAAGAYQKRYQGKTTLRVIEVREEEKEEFDSNRPEPEQKIFYKTYTPIYEYMVNGQKYQYDTRVGSTMNRYQIGEECTGYYNLQNPSDVTETLKEPEASGSSLPGWIGCILGAGCILYAIARLWVAFSLFF